MPRQKFTRQIADVYSLLEVADALAVKDPAISYTKFYNVGHQPFVAGAIVLLCARFEEFLQDSVVYAIDQYQNAIPQVKLSDLHVDQQAHIVAQNFAAAIQKKRFGQFRTAAQRVADVKTFSGYIMIDRVWSDYAIDTGGNPGSDTVTELLKIAGVKQPWAEINALYSTNYAPPSIPGLVARTSLDPAQQLNAVVESRNQAAHKGAHLSLSPADVRFYTDFMAQLSGWIYAVLRNTIDDLIVSKKSTPPSWSHP